MDSHNRTPRVKPSNLAIECHQCGTPIPYDPLSNSHIFSPCQNMVLAQMAPSVTSATFAGYQQQDGYPESPTPTMSSRSHKRHANGPADGERVAKRALTSDYAHPSKRSVRQDFMGSAGGMDDGFDAMEDDDDEFVDAPEDIADRNEDEDEVVTMKAHREAEAKSGETDRFGSTFGPEGGDDSMSEDDGYGDEDTEAEMNKYDEDSEDGSQSANGEFVESEHAKGCTQTRGESTPPDSQVGPPLQSSGPRAPDPAKDINSDLQKFKKWHDRAIELIPRLPLAEHRYWIGVLNVGVKAMNIKHEKDFTWMKGNRLTTVETVWHMYQQTTAIEKFVLLLGYERVEFRDKVEELDYFNNKKIMFRAVEADHQDAKGHELGGCVVSKEVVPKTISTEVIVIDD